MPFKSFVMLAVAVILCFVSTPAFSADLSLVLLTSSRLTVFNDQGQSCAGAAVAPLRVEWPQVQIAWRKPVPLEDFTLVMVVQDARIVGGHWLCEIPAEEVQAAFGLQRNELPGASSSRSSCALQCGSLRLIDESRAFRGVGTLSVFGNWRTSPGSGPRQIRATVPFELHYSP